MLSVCFNYLICNRANYHGDKHLRNPCHNEFGHVTIQYLTHHNLWPSKQTWGHVTGLQPQWMNQTGKGWFIKRECYDLFVNGSNQTGKWLEN